MSQKVRLCNRPPSGRLVHTGRGPAGTPHQLEVHGGGGSSAGRGQCSGPAAKGKPSGRWATLGPRVSLSAAPGDLLEVQLRFALWPIQSYAASSPQQLSQWAVGPVPPGRGAHRNSWVFWCVEGTLFFISSIDNGVFLTWKGNFILTYIPSLSIKVFEGLLKKWHAVNSEK